MDQKEIYISTFREKYSNKRTLKQIIVVSESLFYQQTDLILMAQNKIKYIFKSY